MMTSKVDIKDWNTIASAYSDQIEAHGDRCFPEVRERLWQVLGDLQDKAILDLGCGQGWLTGELAKRGAQPVGVDGSNALVERARFLFPGTPFHVADLSGGIPGLGIAFDIVISHMVVMDIPEIVTLFQSVADILKSGGSFLFTIPHPCFFMQKSHQDETGQWYKKLTAYLDPVTRRIESFGGHNHYHRPLSDYVSALTKAGLLVSEFHEPPHESRSDRIPAGFLRKFPVFLMIMARKIAEPSATGDA